MALSVRPGGPTTFGPAPPTARGIPALRSPGASGEGAGIVRGEQAVSDVGMQVKLSPIDNLTPKELLPASFYFQCAPLETLSWSKEWVHEEYEVASHDTHDRPQARGLKTVSFSTLVVDYDAPWTFYSVLDPIAIGHTLEKLGDGLRPFLLSIRNRPLWGGAFDVRIIATLRSLSVEERAGEPDARYHDVSFKQHNESGLASKVRKKVTVPVRHKLARGDTPSRLAKRFYGSNAKWRELLKANGIKGLQADSDLLAWGRRTGRKTILVPVKKSVPQYDDIEGL